MQQTSSQDKTRLGGKGDPQGIVQKIEIWPWYQMVYTQTRINSGEWDAQNSLGFWNTNRSLNHRQKFRSNDN